MGDPISDFDAAKALVDQLNGMERERPTLKETT
jgi:hypothetical protein